MTASSVARPVPWRAIVLSTVILAAGTGVALGLLQHRMELAGDARFAFLVWNLILAWIPFGLAAGLLAAHRRGWPGWTLIPGLIAWLLFLPNAPYIVTDFVHLRTDPPVPLALDATLIGVFAGTGVALGLVSLLMVHRVIAERLGALAGWGTVWAAAVLCGVGVYLGRVLRFNSWDVLTNPHGLLQVALSRLADPFGNPTLIWVVAGFTGLLGVGYLLLWLTAHGADLILRRRTAR